MMRNSWLTLIFLALIGCEHDSDQEDSVKVPDGKLSVILAGGLVYSGDDVEALVADVGFRGDRITDIGDLSDR